jgi:hypothetical protein
VTQPRHSAVVRRALWVAALAPAVTVPLLAGPAFADEPADWPPTDNGSTVHALLLLFGVPFLIFIVIVTLTYLPSMVRGQRYEPSTAWRDQHEWFGGPSREGEAQTEQPADRSRPAGDHGSDRGGASANW